jgi:putative Mn2+ efflux pump MntP
VGILEILAIAAGLSMDAFALSITLGLAVVKPRVKEILMPGLFFGFFQAFMPLAGYFAGSHFARAIQSFAPWIVFAVFGVIGGKMMQESLSKKEEKRDEHAFRLPKMFLLAIATSIDALAVGITFSFFKVRIFNAALVIGAVTFFLSMLGVKIGNVFGAKYKAKAELTGGLVLIILGVKRALEHIFSLIH